MNQPLDDVLLDSYLDEWVKQFVEEHPCEGGVCQDIHPGLGSGQTTLSRQQQPAVSAIFAHVTEAQQQHVTDAPRFWGPKDHHLLPSHLQPAAPFKADYHFDDSMIISPLSSLHLLTHQQFAASPASIVAQQNETFRFESGAVVVEDSSSRSKTAKQPRTPGDFKCSHSNCKYRGTFRRSYELQRHMKKHTEERFRCPVQSCERSFYRIDKVRHHLMESHAINESTCCPLSGCRTGAHPLGLLGVHVLEHPGWFKEPVLQVFNWLTDGKRCCPKPSCKQWTHVFSMQEHIRSHHISERYESEEAIRKSGYDINANIICPVCGKTVTTLAGFEVHMETRHLVFDVPHLQSCRFAAIESMDEDSRTPAWEPWKTYDTRTIKCQGCYSKVDQSSGWLVHHLSLLQDPAIIRPFRQQILELLGPEFASHPVFDDVRVK